MGTPMGTPRQEQKKGRLIAAPSASSLCVPFVLGRRPRSHRLPRRHEGERRRRRRGRVFFLLGANRAAMTKGPGRGRALGRSGRRPPESSPIARRRSNLGARRRCAGLRRVVGPPRNRREAVGHEPQHAGSLPHAWEARRVRGLTRAEGRRRGGEETLPASAPLFFLRLFAGSSGLPRCRSRSSSWCPPGPCGRCRCRLRRRGYRWR